MAAFTEEQVKDFSIKNWYDLSGQVARCHRRCHRSGPCHYPLPCFRRRKGGRCGFPRS